MFRKKSSKKDEDKDKDKDRDGMGSNNSKALVAQDPRTRVKTTSAATESTNTTVQNATIINNNTNTVTFRTTRQTVTHTQQARITEIVSRHTATEDELKNLFAGIDINAASMGSHNRPAQRSSNGILRQTSFKRNSGSTFGTVPLNALALKSTLEDSTFFSDAKKRSSTIMKTEKTTVSQKNGQRVTQHVEEHRIKLKPNSSKWRTTTKTTTTMPATATATATAESKSATGVTVAKSTPRIGYSLDARPFGGALTNSIWPPSTTTTTTYTSPYAKPTIGGNSIPTIFSYPVLKPVSTSTTIATPTLTTATTNTKAYPGLKSSWLTSTSSPGLKSTNPNLNSIRPSISSPGLKSSSASLSSTTSGLSSKSLQPTTEKAVKSSSVGSITPTLKSNITIPRKSKSRLKPGFVYIFNHEKFDNPQNEERVGSQADVKQLQRVFELFKCKVTIINNATVKDINKHVAKIEKKDYNENSCLVIVILSHGSRLDYIAAKDGSYSIDDNVLFPILRNQTLNNKPKIFIIQACKGDMEVRGFKKDAVSINPDCSPNQVLKCYSTFEGFASYRSTAGSIFIQQFCKHLEKSGRTKDIEDIMADVRMSVITEYQGTQIPSVMTSLTTKYKFGDYV